jgi:hypothetical protein
MTKNGQIRIQDKHPDSTTLLLSVLRIGSLILFIRSAFIRSKFIRSLFIRSFLIQLQNFYGHFFYGQILYGSKFIPVLFKIYTCQNLYGQNLYSLRAGGSRGINQM